MTTTVLLYSGGLDSYITACLHKPDVLLHVQMGGRYGNSEAQGLIVPTGSGRLIQAALPLAQWERDDMIIPGRNAHLCLAAANYGDHIMLAATAGDRVRDKDDGFAYRMTTLLNYLYQPQWWIPQGQMKRVDLPVKHLTKRALVAAFLKLDRDPDELNSTFSCYAPDRLGRSCRGCKPCIRKWAALVVNGVAPADDCRSEAVRAWEAGEYRERGQETHDMAAALRMVGVAP